MGACGLSSCGEEAAFLGELTVDASAGICPGGPVDAVCGRLGEKEDTFLLSEVDLGDEDSTLEGAVESISLPREPHELSDKSPELEPTERRDVVAASCREASEVDEAGKVDSEAFGCDNELLGRYPDPASNGLLLPPALAGRLT